MSTAQSLPNRLVPLCFHFIGQYRWGCAGLVFFPILTRALFASIAYATKGITDTILALKNPAADGFASVAGPLAVFTALIISRFFIDCTIWFCSYHTRAPMVQQIKLEVFALVQRHSPEYFESTLSGKIAHKTVMLPDQLAFLFDSVMFDFIPAAAFFLTIAAYFYLANPLFCAAVLFWVIVYFSICWYMGSKCGAYAGRHNAAKTQVTGRIVDVITNIKNVFFFSNQRFEDTDLSLFTAEEKRRRMALYLSFVRMRVVQWLLDITMWLALFGGAIYAWIHGAITAGDFVMITTLAGLLIKQAYEIGQKIPEFYDYVGSAQESIDTLIVPRTVEDAPGAPKLALIHAAIVFDRIAFAYNPPGRAPEPPPHRVLFQDFSLTIPPGQRLGLVGPSGAGKSTLMALLMRMHDVEAGAILLNGQDIRGITQESLRSQIGLIPQDTSLFHRTLLDNIRYGRPAALEAEVIEAARRAHAHEFICGLEHGYHTMVGERGVKLSGGQRQRIAIARAILKDAPILLLDEATSALDSDSEHIIRQAMHTAMQGKTVIAIAHRLSTLMDMDRLVVIHHGRIVADGSHSQLLRQGGLYADLWSKQSGGFLAAE